MVKQQRRQTRCVGCNQVGRVTSRAAPYPGPRCLEHWRAEKKRRAGLAHARRLADIYDITPDEYRAVYLVQKGCCPICLRATGKTKNLSVDHEHDKPGCQHPPEKACFLCIRGLLCDTCNHILIGRYDEAALRRAINYLRNPPARAVLARMRQNGSS